jgi:hypothetical protein
MPVIAWYRPTPPRQVSATANYVSLPHLYGESKTAIVGSVSRVPAAEIEDVIVKSLNDHLVAEKEKPNSSITQGGDRRTVLEQVARIDVHQDRLTIFWKPADAEEASDPADGRTLSVPWQKPPSRKSRQILIPNGVPQNEVRPTRIERRARLVSAIAHGRRWLDEIVSNTSGLPRSADIRRERRQRSSARSIIWRRTSSGIRFQTRSGRERRSPSASGPPSRYRSYQQRGAGDAELA